MQGGLRRIAVLLAGVALGAPAGATSLRDALNAVYRDNPQLTAQRAGLRATDEQYAIIKANGLPTVGANGQVTQGVRNFQTYQGVNRIVTAGAQLSVPLYQGGRVRNAMNAADQRVRTGQQQLRATEGDVFVQAVSAYMDVLRDRAIVSLNENNVKVLQTNLDASNDRFQAGDLTRTDVAQSQARLEGARAQLSLARSNLTASEENYRAVIGQPAGTLDQPPVMPLLPADADRAEVTALEQNPQIAAAAANVRAYHYDVSTARANRMPSISASASENYYKFADAIQGNFSAPSGDYATVGVTATLPLYQGGLAGAQVRQAQAFEQQAMEQQTQTERQVVANTRAAFAAYQAQIAAERSSEEQVKANTLALEGLRAEQGVGLRQVLDVLNGEQELLSARVNLVTAQRDAYVAGFQLLNAMGLVNYRRLGLDGGPLYDPDVHYDKARHRISDWSEDPRPAPQARPLYGPAVPPEIPPVTPLGN